MGNEKRFADTDEFLILDELSQRDLELFESTADGCSLFEFCDRTRTEGGAPALRKRMQRPWASSARILETQSSLKFIQDEMAAFTKLPSTITQHVDRFQREILISVTQLNVIEFTIATFSLVINHNRRYHAIVRGVQNSCAFIRGLRRFMDQDVLTSAPGELTALLTELNDLLSRENIKKVPNQEIESSTPRKILRLDQIFRLHEKSTIIRLLKLNYEIDALVSLADLGNNSDFHFPTVNDEPSQIHATQLCHPFLKEPVANPVTLNQSSRAIFLTGPNMAGKTTYLRSIATALYLAQLGAAVPAKSFSFSPMQRLFSSITLSDDLHSGVSYFRAEALRVKTITKAIAEGYRVIALMDEPFKGTNIKDAFDASLAILERFAAKEECLFLFSSHLIELGESIDGNKDIALYYFEAQEDKEKLFFDYKIKEGISNQRLGMRVMKEEGVFDLLDDI